jgi:hypothetical protein
MQNKIKRFKRDAGLAKRDGNSISELKMWLQADNLIPTAVKDSDKAYVELKEIKHKLTQLYHDLQGEDAVDMSSAMEQLDKALESMETMLTRYAGA